MSFVDMENEWDRVLEFRIPDGAHTAALNRSRFAILCDLAGARAQMEWRWMTLLTIQNSACFLTRSWTVPCVIPCAVDTSRQNCLYNARCVMVCVRAGAVCSAASVA